VKRDSAVVGRFYLVLLTAIFSVVAQAQKSPTNQQMGPTEILGDVRVEGRPAPPGVLVLLDYASSQDAAPLGSGELGRTVTDSSGRFRFGVPGQIAGRRQVFALTAHFSGFKDAAEVIDLTAMPRGHVIVEMHRDTSKEAPSVPPGGPGATVSARQPASKEATEALVKGRDLLLEKHDPKGSIEKLKKAAKSDPNFAPTYVLLGTAYVQTQNWRDAQAAFEKASSLDPGNSEAFFGVGYALNQQKDFGGAQKPLLRSLELNPNSPEAHYEMGRNLWAQGRWQEAETHARQAITLKKDFPPCHILMGNIYLRHRDAQSALSEFQTYMRLDPQGPYSQAVGEMIAKIQKATR
jgi:Flp pilus assembly protein TadD